MAAMSVIEIPEELARELDLLAEAEHRRRTPYVVDLLWQDVKRNKQRQALKLSAGAWKAGDHPELAKGGASYVEQIRSEADERFEDAMRRKCPVWPQRVS
jgi:predicted transcriptional regulator